MRNVGSPDFQLYEIEHLGVTAQLGTDENIEELGGVYCFFVYDSIAYEMLLCTDSMEQVKEMLEKLTLEG